MNEDTSLHIGLIGYGTIGRKIHEYFAQDSRFRFTLFTRPGADNPVRSLPAGMTSVDRLADFIASKPLIVAEVASQEAVAAYVPEVLAAHIPTIVSSVGALADQNLRDRLNTAAKTGAPLTVPGGAVGGLDYLRTVADLPDTVVTYTSRKPPAAWAQQLAERGLSPSQIAGTLTLFEGTASEAARLFPRNLNVAMTIALACGKAALTVRVLADPASATNSHEIDVASPVGKASFRFHNTAFAYNPKTSVVTVLSIIRELEDFLENNAGGQKG